ncbi:MAG: hypothetical protein K0Q55_142 [Verrucomicrobia bacterium]|jgi:hypothetical protein|nr:hypothetical protein [Verrucomicrobiota bacterium]
MIVVWFVILSGLLLAAFISGSFGILCTKDRGDLISGLCFGLPAVLLSLLVLHFCIGAQLNLFACFAIVPLITGLTAIWRSICTNDKRKNLRSFCIASLVLLAVISLFTAYPNISKTALMPFLPGSPIL